MSSGGGKENTMERETEREQIQMGDGPSVRSITRRRALSFREAYERAYRQIEAETLMRPGEERPAGVLHVILKVMADAYSKGGSVGIQIAGEVLAARDVQAVYEELGVREIYELIGRMEGAECVNMAGYLRTALYNAGLEAGL